MIATKNPNDLLEYCRDNGVPFVLEQTMFTKKIRCVFGEFKWNQNTDLTLKELSFITKVKRHFETLKEYPNVNRSNINYIKQGKIKNGRLKKELFEIDLKSAYWELSKLWLSKELYKEGLGVKKKVRLMALGNLAKQISVFNFDGVEFTDKPTFIKSENTENYFFKVSQETDLIMRNLIMIAQNSFLFYWVDAIFIDSKKNKNFICDFLESNNIDFKVVPIYSIVKKNHSIEVLNENPNLCRDSFKRNKRTFLFTKNKAEVLSKFNRKQYE